MIIIGSYHKTGTLLFLNIWKEYFNTGTLLFYNIWKEYFNLDTTKYTFNDHFNEVSNDDIKKFKCIVIIRNPYEIIMSGTRYHQITKEKCFHFKQEKYNNKTYQEHILSLNHDDKILFEMNNVGKSTIDCIYNDIKYRNFNNNVLFIKLEDLYDNENISKVCEKIGSHADIYINIELLIRCFKSNLSKNFHRTNTNNQYTYTENFKEIHYSQFTNLFPKDLMKILMYE